MSSILFVVVSCLRLNLCLTTTFVLQDLCRKCKTPYEVTAARYGVLNPFVHCICKYPKYSVALDRCESCLREERRRLQLAYRDFVYQHADAVWLSDEVKDGLWRWINTSLRYPAIVTGVDVW